jgi:hypothetical protein
MLTTKSGMGEKPKPPELPPYPGYWYGGITNGTLNKMQDTGGVTSLGRDHAPRHLVKRLIFGPEAYLIIVADVPGVKSEGSP